MGLSLLTIKATKLLPRWAGDKDKGRSSSHIPYPPPRYSSLEAFAFHGLPARTGPQKQDCWSPGSETVSFCPNLPGTLGTLQTDPHPASPTSCDYRKIRCAGSEDWKLAIGGRKGWGDGEGRATPDPQHAPDGASSPPWGFGAGEPRVWSCLVVTAPKRPCLLLPGAPASNQAELGSSALWGTPSQAWEMKTNRD